MPRQRLQRAQFAFTSTSIGVHIDGTFGTEHAVNTMATALLSTVARRSGDPKLRADAQRLIDELDNEEAEDFWDEWLDDATEVLQDATEHGLTWEWDAGDLVLTQDVERE